MTKYRILIVDDEDDICMILSYSLQQAGYETVIAHSAEEVLEKYAANIQHNNIHLILLDIMMDGMSGIDLAKKLGESAPPIIFLTALNDESTILRGFSAGADDYISKPFRISEVLARIAAVLRRLQTKNNKKTHPVDNIITFEGIVVNKDDMSLSVDGIDIKITRKEFDLLLYLLTHRGQILSREHLLNEVWDKNGYVLERTVDVHITHIRRKLGHYGKHIITKSGYGYFFEN